MHHSIDRRAFLMGGSAAVAGLSVLRMAAPAGATTPGLRDPVLRWLDQPSENPVPDAVGHLLEWEKLDSWYTPNDNFFTVKHYNKPELSGASYALSLEGLFGRPSGFSLAQLQSRCRREVDFTLECSGNTGLPFFIGGIGHARWAGTPLAPLLKEAGIGEDATEIVFWGADAGKVTVTGGWSAAPGSAVTFTEQFARSMSVEEALDVDNLLCWEMNGEPLPVEHGYPLRLIAPGWYGVACVKWLTRIEARPGRFAGRFMARDYVTIREETVGDHTVWTFTTVGKARLKSAPARVAGQKGRYRITGAAWGAPIESVDVRIDDGSWQQAVLDTHTSEQSRGEQEGTAWTFWSLDWSDASPGTHTVTSRATDCDGNVQPDPSEPLLAAKRTYWESNGTITRRVLVP